MVLLKSLMTPAEVKAGAERSGAAGRGPGFRPDPCVLSTRHKSQPLELPMTCVSTVYADERIRACSIWISEKLAKGSMSTILGQRV